jgi:hypothetical protein
MIDFPTSFLAWLAATLIPAFLGLLLIALVGRKIQPRYLAAFAFGIFLWFFVDTILGSATLQVNSGFGGGIGQIGVVVLFLAGVVFFFVVDRKRGILSPVSAIGKYGMVIPFLVAIAVGIHGLGEGAAFGDTAYSTTSTSLLDTFGGVSAGVAYVLHKGLEPMMIGACYAVYMMDQGSNLKKLLRNVFILSLVFASTSLIGAVAGYFIRSLDTTYFFGLGTGTSIYAAFRLAGPLFSGSAEDSSKNTVKIAVAWMLGFMAIYIAALFHS